MSETPLRSGIAQRKKARTLLLQALYQWQLSDEAIDVIEAQFRAANPGAIDWDFFHAALAGIAASAESLDKAMQPFLDRAVAALDPVELAILRLGCYELAQRRDIPPKVAINEAVELAKKFGATDGYKYVNGVLDKVAGILRGSR